MLAAATLLCPGCSSLRTISDDVDDVYYLTPKDVDLEFDIPRYDKNAKEIIFISEDTAPVSAIFADTVLSRK